MKKPIAYAFATALLLFAAHAAAGLLQPVAGPAAFNPPVHGRITGASGTLSFGKGITAVTRIGAGHWQIDLTTPIAENDMVTIVMPESGVYRPFGVGSFDTDSIEVRSWDLAGNPADMNFFITVFAALGS